MAPCPLTQPVILSLISQLSSDMEDKLSLKLFWLMEAVAKINTADEQTGRFVPTVLQPLYTSVDAIFSDPRQVVLSGDPSGTNRNAITILRHTVSEMLKASQPRAM